MLEIAKRLLEGVPSTRWKGYLTTRSRGLCVPFWGVDAKNMNRSSANKSVCQQAFSLQRTLHDTVLEHGQLSSRQIQSASLEEQIAKDCEVVNVRSAWWGLS